MKKYIKKRNKKNIKHGGLDRTDIAYILSGIVTLILVCAAIYNFMNP